MNSLEKFNNLMKMAKEISSSNPDGLLDFARALARSIQSEYILRVAESSSHIPPKIQFKENFFFRAPGYLWLQEYKVIPNPRVLINLSRDPIFPYPWNRGKYSSAISEIGDGKLKGGWRYIPSNHRVSVLLPWGVAIVEGGNHSIMAGILSGEGELVASDVFDLAPLFKDYRCDGKHFVSSRLGVKKAPVGDHRIGALFEVGRLMAENGISFA